jgi:hypothetical protein
VVSGKVKGQKRTRVKFFFAIVLIVVLKSPYQKTPKNVINEIKKKSVFHFLIEIFVKAFRHNCFAKVFLVVFLDSHRQEVPENATKQTSRKKRTSKYLSICSKSFRHGLFAFCKNIFVVFLTPPLPRNAQKRT